MCQGKMPYEKPALETIDVKTLTEAVGPVQAFSSGSSEPTVAPERLASGGNKTFSRR